MVTFQKNNYFLDSCDFKIRWFCYGGFLSDTIFFNFVEQSPSQKADSHSTTPKVPTSFKPEVFLLCSEECPLIIILNQMNAAHVLILHFIEAHCNITTLHLCVGLPDTLFPTRFLTIAYIHFLYVSCAQNMIIDGKARGKETTRKTKT
jgi:hypothetical protein